MDDFREETPGGVGIAANIEKPKGLPAWLIVSIIIFLIALIAVALYYYGFFDFKNSSEDEIEFLENRSTASSENINISGAEESNIVDRSSALDTSEDEEIKKALINRSSN